MKLQLIPILGFAAVALVGLLAGGLATYAGWAGLATVMAVAAFAALLFTSNTARWAAPAIAFALGVERLQLFGAVTIVQAVSLLAAAGILLGVGRELKEGRLDWNAQGLGYGLIPAFAYAAYFLASGLWGFDSSHFITTVSELAKVVLVYCIVLFTVNSRNDIRRLQFGLLLGCLASLLLALPSLLNLDAIGFRLTGGIAQPNYFASHVSLGVLALVAWGRSVRQWWKWPLYLLAVIGLIAVFLSASRGAIIGLLFGLLALGWTRKNWFSITLVALIIAGAVSVTTPLAQWLPRQITTRFVLDEAIQTGGAGRLAIWEEYITLFQEYPLAGVGAGDAQSRLGIPYEESEHNTFLGVLVEGGMIGFCLFMVMILAPLVRLRKSRKVSVKENDDLLQVLPIQLISFLVMGIFGGYELRKVLWVMIAATHALTRVRIKEDGCEQVHSAFLQLQSTEQRVTR